jgi:serine/threonine protein phosphatase PrpC
LHTARCTRYTHTDTHTHTHTCAQAALFCIFDGHHGRGAAEQAAALLPPQLIAHLRRAPAAAAAAAETASGAGAGAGSQLGAPAAAAATDADSSAGAGEGPPLLLRASGAAAAAAALEAAFLEADAALTSDDGCTATVAILEAVPAGGSSGSGGGGGGGRDRGGVALQVANVGDSEALLVDLRARWGAKRALAADE